MIVGIPKEIKPCEYRVGMTPEGVKTIVQLKHKVYVQTGAGEYAGFSDEEYKTAGAVLVDSPKEIYDNAELIIKVKEPQPSEFSMLRKNQILFCYLHLANDEILTAELLDKKVVSIAYETLQTDEGDLPLLIPMSEIAGKMSVQIAASLLEKNRNGKGILLGGVPGVQRGRVVILGAGHVGVNATKIAVGLGAEVSVLDINIMKLRRLEEQFGSSISTYLATQDNISRLIQKADALIGAVLVPGAKTPHLITEEMVKAMQHGSVIIDISVNQGGMVETMEKLTTLDSPTFVKDGVTHYCVDNIASSVPRTSTIALTNESLKYIIEIAQKGLIGAIKNDSSIGRGVNTCNGKLTNEAVANSLDVEFTPLTELIGF